ncbi:Apoptosis-inducing factor 2 [Mortierella sp. AD011]|nr:Apoptosis-inducing factor 2 [Mortierella sp. AD010]KAF9400337.1 Apoptosis-inducing factor 2 [Mortierella sp. AD011]
MIDNNHTVHIVVIGGSYGGIACVNKLQHNLPKDLDVAITLVERVDARYHCVASYRALVQKDFAKNLWIPYTNVFPKDSPHKVVRGTVKSIFYDHVLLAADKPSEPTPTNGDATCDSLRINFDYLVIATGSMIPSPAKWRVNSSVEGLAFMDKTREYIQDSDRIVVVGGGACGVELCGEIKYAFPSKAVTLIHRSASLVDYPRYPQSFKDEARRYLEKYGVEVILNESAEIEGLSRENSVQKAERTIRLKESNRTIQSDLQFFSTGMSVDTGFLSTLRPPLSNGGVGEEAKDAFNPDKLLHPHTRAILVRSTLQLEHDGFPHIFAIGDVSNADPVPTCMSAVAAGETAARNIIKLIKKEAKRIDGSHDKIELCEEMDGYLCRSWNKLEDYAPIQPLMVLAMNPTGGVCNLPVLGTWFGNLGAWLVKSNDLFSGRFWKEMNMPRP